MFTSQYECEGLNIVALVELDWQELRVRFFGCAGRLENECESWNTPETLNLWGLARWPKVFLSLAKTGDFAH
jgi:hypothetical protein